MPWRDLLFHEVETTQKHGRNAVFKVRKVLLKGKDTPVFSSLLIFEDQTSAGGLGSTIL